MKTCLHSACKTVLCTLFLFVTGFASLQAQEMRYANIEIFHPRAKVHLLFEAGVSFDHFSYDKNGTVLTVTANYDDLEIFNKNGFRYRVIDKDAVSAFLKRNKKEDPYKYDDRKLNRTPVSRLFLESPDQPHPNTISTPAAFMNPAGSMGGYYTLAEVYTQINNMRTNYPGLVRIDTMGWTFGGNRVGAATPRPMWVVKISDNVNTDETTEAESLTTGLTHAREGMSMMNIIFYMQYILENYSTNPRIKELVDNRQLYFIPVVNPDGYKYNQDSNPGGGGLHRKNRTTTNVTTNIGTDLNRNYEIGWNEIGIGGSMANPGSSTTTTNDTYRGLTAMSELENQAMRDWLRTRRITMAFNHHSYAEAHIHPACVSSVSINAADQAFLQNSSALMTKYNFYNPGNPFTAIGAVARGSNDDYFLAGDLINRGRIISYSPEIGPNGGGIGGSSFWPLSSQIIPLAKEMFYSNYQLNLLSGAYSRIEDRSPASISATSGSFNFRVYRLGIVDSSTTVSIIPLENVQTVGAPVVISSIATHMGSSDGSIAYTLSGSVTNGSRIRFIWRAVTGGITQVDTVVRFFNGNTTGVSGFVDDMETGTVGTNWVISSGWDYSTATMGGTGAFSGTRSLAESPAAATNYGNSANLTARINRTFNFSSVGSGYMTFWIKHRAVNGDDYLRVQYSTNGGSTWNTFSGRNTVAENKGTIGGVPSFTGIQNVWVREFINLEPVIGTSNVLIRFQFVSDATGADDGFFIDDVAVVTSSTSTTLNSNFISFSGKIQQQKSLLQWEASLDSEHDYFEVQRSSNGVQFNLLDKVYSSGSFFEFIDQQPLKGFNYYRIKQVDKKGSFKYTNIVVLKYDASAFAVSIYPTVVDKEINLKIQSASSETVFADFIDQYGRLMMQRAVEAPEGESRQTFSTGILPAGVYYLKLSKKGGELIATERFIKK